MSKKWSKKWQQNDQKNDKQMIKKTTKNDKERKIETHFRGVIFGFQTFPSISGHHFLVTYSTIFNCRREDSI